MIVTQPYKHSIADQTGVVDLSFYASLSNTTGSGSVGLSGVNHFAFSFSSGRIFSPQGKYISTYEADKGFYISSQVGRGLSEYSVNSQLIGLGQPWPTGRFSWVTSNASGVVLEVDISVSGKIPSFFIKDELNYISGYQDITGFIKNNNDYGDFRVFDIYIDNADSLYSMGSFDTGNIAAGNSGKFVFHATGSGFDDSILRTHWETNFGSFYKDILITGDGYIEPERFISASVDDSIVYESDSLNFIVSVSNYPDTGIAHISLSWLSGVTGSIFKYSDFSRVVTGNISGYITGVGYLSALQTGLVSGYDYFDNVFITAPATGYSYSSLLAATGNVAKAYNVLVRGSGISGVTSGIAAFGYLTITRSGNVQPNSGYFYVPSQIVSGNPSVLYRSSPPSGFTQATGHLFYNTPELYDILYINGVPIQFSTGIGNPSEVPYYYSGIASLNSGINSYTGLFGVTGLVTGQNIRLFALASGESGNGISLSSSGSAGRPVFSSPFTDGGITSYYILTPNASGPSPSGFLAEDFIAATGFIVAPSTGSITGSVATTDFIRSFSDVWGIAVEGVPYDTGSGWYSFTGGYSSALTTGRAYPVSGLGADLSVSLSYANNPFVDSPDKAKLSINLYSSIGGYLLTGLDIIMTGA